MWKKKFYPFLILISFCSILLSCYSVDIEDIDNLENKIKRIGHAGSGFARWYPFNPLPGNSLSSIQLALEKNKADGIEVDVHNDCR